MTDKIAEIRARHERDNRYGDGLYPGAHKDRSWLLAEVERPRAVLDQLARLGNEPNYGNSFGNVMARKALEAKS